VRVSGFLLIPFSSGNPNPKGRSPAMSIDTSTTAPAADRHCPVLDLISNPTRVVTQLA
jgi:hypothetical protein